ncbi:MAG: RluA family pseudouridine synthase, partial [Elusimicrobiota bacterium]
VHAALVAQFENRRVAKEYLAVVRGRVPWARIRVGSPISSEGGEIKVRQAVGGREGSPASTEFVRLSSSKGASLVRALPKTGRLHQIRVHLASLGHPVLGDKLYTGRGEAYLKACRHELTGEDLLSLGAPRQMLHALRIRFAHPTDGRPMDIRAPIPSDMRACMSCSGLRAVP